MSVKTLSIVAAAALALCAGAAQATDVNAFANPSFESPPTTAAEFAAGWRGVNGVPATQSSEKARTGSFSALLAVPDPGFNGSGLVQNSVEDGLSAPLDRPMGHCTDADLLGLGQCQHHRQRELFAALPQQCRGYPEPGRKHVIWRRDQSQHLDPNHAGWYRHPGEHRGRFPRDDPGHRPDRPDNQPRWFVHGTTAKPRSSSTTSTSQLPFPSPAPTR